MSTRSLIAMERDDRTHPGLVDSVFCHYDGYPLEVGQTLRDHYTTPGKIRSLIRGGSLSEIGQNIGVKHDFDYRQAMVRRISDLHPDESYGQQAERLKADPEYQRLSKMCTFFGRDRGMSRDEVAPLVHANVDAMWDHAAAEWYEWVYVYRNAKWFVAEVGGGCGPGLVDANDPNGEAPPCWVALEELSFEKRPGEKREPSDGRYSEIAAARTVRDRSVIPARPRKLTFAE
jgi:hypothetical protein